MGSSLSGHQRAQGSPEMPDFLNATEKSKGEGSGRGSGDSFSIYGQTLYTCTYGYKWIWMESED